MSATSKQSEGCSNCAYFLEYLIELTHAILVLLNGVRNEYLPLVPLGKLFDNRQSAKYAGSRGKTHLKQPIVTRFDGRARLFEGLVSGVVF
jgi:hypothetical protein